MKKYRTESDVLGEIQVPEDALWKSQTQRSLENFAIGQEKMPVPLIRSLLELKMVCAIVNEELHVISPEQKEAIIQACLELVKPEWAEQFPLSVWQTGSGTQTNMNVNEVIATLGNRIAGKDILHPNDTVNASQSSNDVFPTALHMMAASMVRSLLFPVLDRLIKQLIALEKENQDVIKIGRTHFQDATPLYFSQEISGWRSMMEHSREHLEHSLHFVHELAIGASAVGTGINVPAGFQEKVVALLKKQSGIPYRSDPNLFHALSSKDACSLLSGALKTLAANSIKMANDIRYLSSGPRAGLKEIRIPENEPGSSIMPGKINPTQCEALTMVAAQVIGNDAAITFGASQGNFELNVYMPLIAYDLWQSITLLSDALSSFTIHVLDGLKADRRQMARNMEESLMLVTALSPVIGYEKAAHAARHAYLNDLKLRDAVLELGLMDEETFLELTSVSRLVP